MYVQMTFAKTMALHGYTQLTMRFLHRGRSRPPVLCINATPIFRQFEIYRCKRHASSYGGPSLPGQVGPPFEAVEGVEEKGLPREDEPTFRWRLTLFKMIESAATTFMSLMVLGLVFLKSTKDRLG